MYEINGGKARTDLYQKGLGDAHVWDFSDAEKMIESHRRYQQAQIDAKQKAGDLNQKEAEAELAKLNSKAVHPNDVNYFTDSQNKIYTDTKNDITPIRNNDPGARIRLLKRVADFNREADQSANFARYSEAAHVAVNEAQKQGKEFTPESLQAFDVAQQAPHETGWDYTKINPEIDVNLENEIRTRLNPDLEKRAEGVGIEYTDPKTGERVKSDPNKITPEQAAQAQKEFVMSDPLLIKKGARMLSQEPAEIQAKYNNGQNIEDIGRYIGDTKNHLSTFDKSKYSRVETSDNGEPALEIGTIEAPLTSKIKSTGVKGDSISATVTADSQITFSKPVKSIYPITKNMRTVDGNKEINKADVVDVDFGGIKVEPVYKAGTKTYIKQKDGSSKEVDIGGNVVPDEVLEHAKKNDAVEYKPMVKGIAKINLGKTDSQENPIYEEVSITQPASEVKGVFKKSKNLLDQLDQRAQKRNEELSSGTKDVTKEEYDALPKGGKYIHGGKTFIKN